MSEIFLLSKRVRERKKGGGIFLVDHTGGEKPRKQFEKRTRIGRRQERRSIDGEAIK